MMTWNAPTDQQVDQALNRLSTVDKAFYFFDKLENPLWFEPLRARRVFDNCPDDQPWAQSRYLVRVASSFPSEVSSIIRKLKTQNLVVLNDFLVAIMAMPPANACAMIDAVASWLSNTALSKHPFNIVAFTSFVVGNCSETEALSILSAALQIDVEEREAILPGGREQIAVPHIQSWVYDELVDKVLTEFNKTYIWTGLEFTVKLAREALDIETPERRPQDLSYIWLKNIEEPGPLHDLKTKLATAVFKTALTASKEDFPRVARVLQVQHYHLFHRILARVVICLGRSESAANLLLEHGYNENILGTSLERRDLLRLAFSALSTSQRKEIITELAADEPREKLEEFYQWLHGKEPAEETIEQMRRHHRYTQLLLLDGLLDPKTQQILDALKGEFGESEAEREGVRVGPGSPKTQTELRAMPSHAIIEMLKTWRPTGHTFAPSPEGLGRELQAVVAERPTEFLSEVEELCDGNVHPTYVRNIIQGLTLALRQGQELPWDAVFRLLNFATHHERALVKPLLPGEQGFDVDETWENARLVTGHFLYDAFGLIKISCDDLPSAWRVIEPLVNDPDPDAEKFASEYYQRNPMQASINCVRGQTLHVISRYARQKALCADFKDTGNDFFAQAPEIRQVLSARAREDVENNPAVWCTFGWYFGLYFALSPQWATEHRKQIFHTQISELGVAAWQAYLLNNSFSVERFKLLREEYAVGVDNLRDVEEISDGETTSAPLGRHLLAAYLNGLVDLSSTSLLPKYFERASESDRALVLVSLFQYLTEESKCGTLPDYGQILAFLDWRLRSIPVATQSQSKELMSFGWWLITDGTIAHDQLLRLIEAASKTGGVLDGLFALMPSVAESASNFPELAAKLLCAVAPGINPFEISVIREPVEMILRSGLAGGEAAAAQARKANDILIKLGVHDFRNVFKTKG